MFRAEAQLSGRIEGRNPQLNRFDPGFGTFALPGLARLPNLLRLCIDPAPWGHVAEWLRNGLQNRVHQFNSGRGLH